MRYLTELSAEELRLNFELANEHLKLVFSKYPFPIHMEGCPCCIKEESRKSLEEGDLSLYLVKAMSTWGGEEEFKHYIPQLLTLVYLENKNIDSHILPNKLNYIQNWPEEELQAIHAWYSAYSQLYFITDVKKSIEISRSNILDWLNGKTEKLTCEFPFSIFLTLEFDDLRPFLPLQLIEKFASLLDVWPFDDIDMAAYAYCLTNYLIFSNGEYGIFEGKVQAWVKKNQKRLEESFWKAKDPRLQQLFSDSLPPNFYPT